MSDRTLSTYEEPRLDDGPHWTITAERSAAGQPGVFFTIQHVWAYGKTDELTIVVDDADKFLAPVFAWLTEPEQQGLPAFPVWLNAQQWGYVQASLHDSGNSYNENKTSAAIDNEIQSQLEALWGART
jgi:hypothetical protein